MEERLAEYESHHDKHNRRHTVNNSKISNLESEMERVLEEKARAEKRSKSRIQELEDLLANTHADHGEAHAKKDKKLKELMEALETVKASESHHMSQHELHSMSAAQLEKKVEELMTELDVSRAELAVARKELAEIYSTCEDLKRDAEDTVEKHSRLLTSKTQEFELKLSQANDTILSLKEQLEKKEGRKSRPSAVSSGRPSSAGRQSMAKRQTLFGELVRHDYLVGAILPDSRHEFVVKVRKATEDLGDALKSANEAHAKFIHAQLASARDAQSSGRLIKDVLMEYADRQVIDAERKAAFEEVEAAQFELRALKSELPTQHTLSEYDKKEVSARLDLDLSKCNDELELLRRDSALSDVPEAVVLMALRLQDEGADAVWEDGFSPMHWAAKYGRRDVMEYLLRVPEGKKTA
jgi:chromosome segregation ATPase